MKILIIGDSFAADWSIKYKQADKGWPNLLADYYEVDNYAQAGVGEYKILKQIDKIKNLLLYNLVIVSHTSTYRIHTKKHPIHSNDILHKDSDLIFKDIEYHYKKKTLSTFLNKSLKTAYNYFLYHFDNEYQETIYKLIRQEINNKLSKIPIITLMNRVHIVDNTYEQEKNIVILKDIQKKYSGTINHLSPTGNDLAFKEVNNMILSITN